MIAIGPADGDAGNSFLGLKVDHLNGDRYGDWLKREGDVTMIVDKTLIGFFQTITFGMDVDCPSRQPPAKKAEYAAGKIAEGGGAGAVGGLGHEDGVLAEELTAFVDVVVLIRKDYVGSDDWGAVLAIEACYLQIVLKTDEQQERQKQQQQQPPWLPSLHLEVVLQHIRIERSFVAVFHIDYFCSVFLGLSYSNDTLNFLPGMNFEAGIWTQPVSSVLTRNSMSLLMVTRT